MLPRPDGRFLECETTFYEPYIFKVTQIGNKDVPWILTKEKKKP